MAVPDWAIVSFVKILYCNNFTPNFTRIIGAKRFRLLRVIERNIQKDEERAGITVELFLVCGFFESFIVLCSLKVNMSRLLNCLSVFVN